MEQLFIRGLWTHFTTKIHKMTNFHNIEHHIRLWQHGVHLRSQLGMTPLAITFYGWWEIWKIRCRIKYDEDVYNANMLLRKVYHQVQELNLIFCPKRAPSTFETICLEKLEIPVQQVKVKRGKWLCWEKPVNYNFKLNMDGFFKGLLSAGGGVIQDRQ